MHKLVGSFFNRHAVEVLKRPLRLLVDIWFQFYFTPLTGLLFTFPSRYLFTIGLEEYLALPVSSGKFTRAIRVSRYSRRQLRSCFIFAYGTITLWGRAFQHVQLTKQFLTSCTSKCYNCLITPNALYLTTPNCSCQNHNSSLGFSVSLAAT